MLGGERSCGLGRQTPGGGGRDVPAYFTGNTQTRPITLPLFVVRSTGQTKLLVPRYNPVGFLGVANAVVGDAHYYQ